MMSNWYVLTEYKYISQITYKSAQYRHYHHLEANKEGVRYTCVHWDYIESVNDIEYDIVPYENGQIKHGISSI